MDWHLNGLDRYDGYELNTIQPVRRFQTDLLKATTFMTLQKIVYAFWVASDAGIMRIDLQREEISFMKDYEGEHCEVLSSPVQSIL